LKELVHAGDIGDEVVVGGFQSVDLKFSAEIIRKDFSRADS
jgi:hypothetical protein